MRTVELLVPAVERMVVLEPILQTEITDFRILNFDWNFIWIDRRIKKNDKYCEYKYLPGVHYQQIM